MSILLKLHLATAVIVILSSFVFQGGALDIALHDTYLVMAFEHILYLITLLYLVFVCYYWLTHKIKIDLSKLLGWVHYIITTGVFLTLIILNWRISQPREYNEDYSVYDEFDKVTSDFDINYWISILVIIVLSTQILLIINVVRGLIRKSL